MGSRKKKRESYDTFIEENVLVEERNDLKQAQKIKNQEGLQELVKGQNDKAGAIGREIKKRGLVVYGADGKASVDDEAVRREAAALKRETLASRFYPQSYLDEQNQEIQEKYSVGRRAARNIIANDYQIRAQAVLSAANAGKVAIDANTKGVLNNYAAGRYEQAIYGTVDETTGKRTYERGRYFTELGFDDAQKFKGASTSVNTAAARAEKRKDFIENVQAQRGNRFTPSLGVTEQKPKENRFAGLSSSTTQRGLFGEADDKTTKTRQPKETNLAMFSPEEMTGQGKRSNMFGDFRGNMGLEREDRRTDEEKDADRRREALDRTNPFFDLMGDDNPPF